ncbi:MAG: thioesterase family protein [Candidatus Binatia bacterium]|nr:thioesterase family protein [Candidatus Binatia bacterium]
MPADDAIFRRSGGRFEPTLLAQGPWSPDHAHGGAVAGLIAHVAGAEPSPVPMRVARLTLDLLHPVPLRPLSVTTQVQREGRRVQLLHVSLTDGDRQLVHASVQRIRVEPGITSAVAAEAEPTESRPDPSHGIPAERMSEVPGFIRAIDYARAPQRSNSSPVLVWLRLRCSLVEGEAVTPLVRAAVAGDFTSGTASGLDWQHWRYINPDLSVHLEREPIGEWVAVEASARLSNDGTGQSYSRILDFQGVVGRGQASMFVERQA